MEHIPTIHEVTETIKRPIHWVYKVLAGLGWFTLSIVSILCIMVIAINTPKVQTWITNKLGGYLKDQTGYNVTVGYANIAWFNAIQFENIIALDHKNDTIVNIGHIELHYDINELLMRNAVISTATLRNTAVICNLNEPKNQGNFNDLISKVIDLISGKAPTVKSKNPSAFSIHEVHLENCFFRLNQMSEKPILNKLDYNHMDFTSINGCINTLKFRGDTTFLGIEHLNALEKQTNTKIHQLTAKFFVCSTSMEFKRLHASIAQSEINDYIRFNYKSYDDFSDFNNKVVLTSRLKNSHLAWADLRKLFVPDMQVYPGKLFIDGKVKGQVSNLDLIKTKVRFGDSSYVTCDANFKGLPEWDQTKITLALHKSLLSPKDLQPYISKNDYATASKFKFAKVAGTLVGKPSSFHTIAKIESGIGQIKADIDLALNPNPAFNKYDGIIATDNLAYGTLADNPDLNNISMVAKIKGMGLTLASVNAKLEANISSIGIKNYPYKNLIVSATLAKQLFNGHAAINDPNLIMTASGVINLNKGIELIEVQSGIQNINFNALEVKSPISFLKTSTNIKLRYFDIDKIQGEVHFENTTLGFPKDTLLISSISAFSTHDPDGSRTINLESDIATATASGKFTFSQLFKEIPASIQQYVDELSGESRKNLANASKTLIPNNIEFTAKALKLSPLLKALQLPLNISNGSYSSGSISTGATNVIQLSIVSDTIQYEKYNFIGNEIDLSTSRTIKTGDVVGSVYARSQKQHIASSITTEKLLVDGDWIGKEIDLKCKLAQENSPNFINLNAVFDLLETKTELRIRPSVFHFLNQDWRIADSNIITFMPGKKININKLNIENSTTSFSTNGNLGENPEDILNIQVNKFDISSVNAYIIQPIFGYAHGKIEASSVLKHLKVSTEFRVDSMKINNINVGNIGAAAAYDSIQNSINITASISQFGKIIGIINGDYKIDDEKPLRFIAKLNNAPINILQPYITDIATNLDGKGTGSIKIGGKITALELSGNLDIKGGQLVLPTTGVRYSFNHNIIITPTSFNFSGTRITDNYANVGFLSKGVINHSSFDNWNVQIVADFNKIQVLNLPKKDNEVYYGQVYATGKVSLIGPAQDLVLTADASTSSGSKLFLPISNKKSASNLGENIVFTNTNHIDSLTFIGQKANLLTKSGISMEFNIDVTPDAEIEIIFDEKSGEKIKVNGSGRMKLQYDTRGDLSLYGQYIIDKGTYNFTLSNAINKKFNIQQGSNIVWNGNPWDGLLNIHATHELYALLTPLISDAQLNGIDRATALNQPIYKRKYLSSVILDLTGPILKPEIKMNIEIKDKPTEEKLATAIANFESVILTNENILNQEIISLFLIRSFTSIDNSSGFSGAALAGGTISELLSNQFSNWLSQVNNNIEIQLDVNGVDAAALSNLQLRLSYALLDGRLRVTRSGGFQSSTSSSGTSNNQTLAGDWTLEYRLGKESKFWIKAFMRNNQVNSTTNTQLSTNTTTGATISHSTSFNSLSELLGRKNKPKPEQEKQPEIIKLKSDEIKEMPDSSNTNIPSNSSKN